MSVCKASVHFMDATTHYTCTLSCFTCQLHAAYICKVDVFVLSVTTGVGCPPSPPIFYFWTLWSCKIKDWIPPRFPWEPGGGGDFCESLPPPELSNSHPKLFLGFPQGVFWVTTGGRNWWKSFPSLHPRKSRWDPSQSEPSQHSEWLNWNSSPCGNPCPMELF